MSLIDQLDDARAVRVDKQRRLVLAWFGGHGVHAYDEQGKEVSFWNTGSFKDNNADEDDVRESMDQHIKSGDYP